MFACYEVFVIEISWVNNHIKIEVQEEAKLPWNWVSLPLHLIAVSLFLHLNFMAVSLFLYLNFDAVSLLLMLH